MVDVQQLYPQLSLLSVREELKRPALCDITNQVRGIKRAKVEVLSCAPKVTVINDVPYVPVTLSPSQRAQQAPPILGSIKVPLLTSASLSSALRLDDLSSVLSYLGHNALLSIRTVCKQWNMVACAVARRFSYEDDHLSEVMPIYKVPYPSRFLSSMIPKIRATLIDWLAEVNDEFKLDMDTFFTCVNYIDRYLTINEVPTSKLQLVGVACLLIASKMEEIYPPALQDLVEVSDYSVTQSEIVQTEQHILMKLQFYMASVTPRSFLLKYLKFVPEKHQIANLAQYLMALSAVDISMCKYSASLVAASCLCLALHTFGERAWTEGLTLRTRHHITDSDMRECLQDLHNVHKTRPLIYGLTGVYDIFSKDTYGNVATSITPAASLPTQCFPCFSS